MRVVKSSLELWANRPTALLEDAGRHWEQWPGLPHAVVSPRGALLTRSASLPQ